MQTCLLKVRAMCVALAVVVFLSGPTWAETAVQTAGNRPVEAKRQLSEMLNELKDRYKVHILFSDQQVEGLYIRTDALNYSLEIEKNLESILFNTGLRFRKAKGTSFLITGRKAKKQASLDDMPNTARTSLPETKVTVPSPAIAEQIVKGILQDEKGEVLPGVNVVLKGTQLGTITDAAGKFELQVPDQNAILIFSFVGYISQEVTVANKTSLEIRLMASEKALDEVVVIGYGTVLKKDLTGSVSSVKMDNLRSMPVGSLDQALHGQAAGVHITQSSGAPGATSLIRIRGGNSINGGNEPLFVIDGMPVGGTGGLGTGAVRSPAVNALSLINPSDIESVEILKDASATAIYGSRGANGVILITTKSGKKSKARISLEMNTGLQQPRNIPTMLNAKQYAAATNEYNSVVGLAPKYTADQIDALGNGTNWLDEILRTAPISNFKLSVQGGDESLKYYLSGGYFGQQGILKNSKLDRYSLTFNMEKKLTKKLTINNNSILSLSNNDGVISEGGYSNTGVSSAIYTALQYDPTAPVKNAAGDYNFSPLMELPRLSNPVAIVNDLENSSKMLRVLQNMSLKYEIVPDLILKVSGGMDLMINKESFYEGRGVIEGRDNSGVARLGNVQSYGFLNENTLSYNKVLNSVHRLNALAGVTIQSSRTESMQTSAKGFIGDQLGAGNLGAASGMLPSSSGIVDWALLSYLARVNYAFDDRFLLTGTARYDGSSRFGKNNKFGFFPSAAVAWRLSQEDLIKNLDVFSDLKLRASYGLTGNQAVSPYQSIQRLASYRTIFNDEVHVGFSPSNIANPYLGWEKTAQFDVGLDMAFAKDILVVTLDYYRKKTSNLLFNRSLQYSSGFESALTNIGKLRNDGVEINVNSTLRLGHVNWNVNMNASRNLSKVLNMGSTERYMVTVGEGAGAAVGNILVEIGQPLGNFFGYISDGIFQNAQEVAASAQLSAKPGDRRFKDISGPDGIPDGRITEADRTVIGNFQPKWQFGFSNSFSWKGLELNLVMQGVVGNSIYNSQRMHFENFVPNNNASVAILDAWTPANPSNSIPRLGTGENSKPLQMSTHFIEKGSYLRMKNVSLGYYLPERWMKGLRISNIKMYASGQDLLTFTKYTGFDPEVNRYGQDNLRQGVDLGGYPRARTYTFGIVADF